MKLSKIRTIVAAAVFCVLAVGLIAGINMGTLSGFGFDSFSALCPLGAITTMLATKTLVPRAVFSIIIMAVVLFFRKGIMGDRELFQKKPASTAKAAKKEARSK